MGRIEGLRNGSKDDGWMDGRTDGRTESSSRKENERERERDLDRRRKAAKGTQPSVGEDRAGDVQTYEKRTGRKNGKTDGRSNGQAAISTRRQRGRLGNATQSEHGKSRAWQEQRCFRPVSSFSSFPFLKSLFLYYLGEPAGKHATKRTGGSGW